jgi:hypothetical protein
MQAIGGWVNTLRHRNQAIQRLYSPGHLTTRRDYVYLVVRIVIMLVAYMAFEYWLRRAVVISFAGYTQPLLVFEVLHQLVSGIIPLAGLGLVVASTTIGRKTLLNRWAVFEQSAALRLLICVITFVTAWAYSTYSYNFYFDQGHYADRLLLISLAILVWWRPVFVIPYTALLMCILGQFNYPLTDQASLLASFNLLLHALQLFSVFVLLHLVTGTRRTVDFIFVLCCLIGASYFRPGLGKLQVAWLSHPYLYFLLPGGYSNGWLAFLQPEQLTGLTQFIRPFVLPMMVFTLLVELGSLFFMAYRRLLYLYFPLCIAFHIGVMLMCGIFFWHWIVLEVALLGFFFLVRKQPLQLNTKVHMLLALVLIVGGSVWFRSINLAWYDTNLYYGFRYEGITASGQKVMLDNRMFSPYGDLFRFENFSFLSREPQLTATYGAVNDLALATALVQARTPEEIFALEAQYPNEPYNPVPAEQFANLIATFISNWNRHKEQNPAWWSFFEAPGQLLGFPRPNETGVWAEPIEQVNVYQITTFFDGEIYSTIRQRIMLEVSIPATTG